MNQSGPIFETSEGIAEIAAALAKAQSEFGPIHKDAKAEERGVAKGSGKPYSMTYSYAKLPKILAAIMPALSKNGICLVQAAGLNCVVTRIAHSSGEWMQCTTPVFPGRMDGARGWGSGVSYSKRFGVMSITGVAPDDESDDDGAMADGPAPYRNHDWHANMGQEDPAAQLAREGMPEPQTPRPRPDPAAAARQFGVWMREQVSGKDINAAAEIMEREDNAKRLGRLRSAYPDIYREIMVAAGLMDQDINPDEEGATLATPRRVHASH